MLRVVSYEKRAQKLIHLPIRSLAHSHSFTLMYTHARPLESSYTGCRIKRSLLNPFCARALSLPLTAVERSSRREPQIEGRTYSPSNKIAPWLRWRYVDFPSFSDRGWIPASSYLTLYLRYTVARNKPEVYCLTRSVGNRRWDVLRSLESFQSSVTVDFLRQRFALTRILSSTRPLSHPFTSSPSLFLSDETSFSSSLSVPIYLFLLTLETRVRVHR